MFYTMYSNKAVRNNSPLLKNIFLFKRYASLFDGTPTNASNVKDLYKDENNELRLTCKLHICVKDSKID